jgi:hypothetical protein
MYLHSTSSIVINFIGIDFLSTVLYFLSFQNLKNILLLPSSHPSSLNHPLIEAFNEQIELIFTDESFVSLIQRDLNWGRSMEYFLVVLRVAICRLSTSQQFLTTALVNDCLKQMELPFSVLDTLQSLPQVQLYILISIIRLHCRTHSNKDLGTDSSKKTSRKRKKDAMFTIKDVIHETDRIMGLIRRKVGILWLSCSAPISRFCCNERSSMPLINWHRTQT